MSVAFAPTFVARLHNAAGRFLCTLDLWCDPVTPPRVLRVAGRLYQLADGSSYNHVDPTLRQRAKCFNFGMPPIFSTHSARSVPKRVDQNHDDGDAHFDRPIEWTGSISDDAIGTYYSYRTLCIDFGSLTTRMAWVA